MALRTKKSTTNDDNKDTTSSMSFAETVRQLNGHKTTSTMNEGGGGGGGVFSHQQKENLPQRRHTYYNMGTVSRNSSVRKGGSGTGAYADSSDVAASVKGRSTSVVLDSSGIHSVGVHASSVINPATLMMPPLRACPTAKIVCWSVKSTLAHPLTPQRLCPQPLRRKLYQRGGGGGGFSNHNHIDLLETEWTATSDEEVSSGDEEELTSLEKDECIGKLAFGRRKLKLFDQVTSTHQAKARKMIKQYWREVHNIRFESKLNILQQEGTTSVGEGIIGNEDLDTLLMGLDRDLSGSGEGGPQNEQDANAVRVALVIQSLLVNPQESLEGIAECYDGLVAAGAALIEHEDQKNRSISVDSASGGSQTNQKSDAEAGESSNRNSDPRSVLATLTPLLITTLEPMPGEAILQISKLYSLCATVRYKRRFVHRIAPLLVRPSSSAVWCVKHQNDMAAIIVVTEFLMEHASDIFSPQWVERGRLLKADGLRAENLRLAALQLKNLDKKETVLQNISSKAGGGGLVSMPSQDGSDTGLAEWEVLDVDRYIRSSIRFVFDRQWTSLKATKHHAPSGRIIHHNSALMAPSGLTVTSTGGGGCPMSPRKIPLSPSTYVNPSPSSSSVVQQYMMEVPPSASSSTAVGTTTTPSNNNNNTNPISSPAASASTGFPPPLASVTADGSSGAPLTPKPGSIQSLNTSNLIVSGAGTPPRSPSSPPKTSRTLGSADTSALGLNPPTLSNVIQVSGAAGGNSSVNNASGITSTAMIQTSGGSSTPGVVMKRSYAPVIHYTLTKSAEERKRTVAACRALRAQINRFEEAFFQIHNRHPKGAAERAPLATTYAQYREWKRAIRADAATRIQALFRGALARWTMLQRNSPRLTEVVRRSSRRSIIDHHANLSAKQHLLVNGVPPPPVSSIGNSLGASPPSGIAGARGGQMEIDNKSVASGNTYGMDVEERTCVSTEGVELIINTAGGRRGKASHKNSSSGGKHHQGGSASPSSGGGGGWNLGRNLRAGKHGSKDGGPFDGGGRAHLLSPKPLDAASTANSSSASGDSYHGGGVRGGVGFSFMKAKANSSSGKYSKVHSSGNSIDSGSDSEASQSSRGSRGSYSASSQSLPLADASLADLMVQKRELKAQLKSYDLNFAKRHGRMPVKAEKEPIRKLYEQYNALKAHISMLESGGAGAAAGGAGGGSTNVNMLQSGSMQAGAGGLSAVQSRTYGSSGGATNATMSNRRGGPGFGSSDRSVDSAGSEDSFGRQVGADMIQKMRSGGGGRSSSSVGSGASSTVFNNNNAMNFDNLFPMDQQGGGGGSVSSGGSAPLPTDLRALKEEKGTLHQMLRSYEKDFFREHNRQVSSFADIRPVASQYRRYKEIKKAIAAQQAAERST